MLFFASIFFAVLLEVVGDIFFKKWSLEQRYVLLFTGLAIYFMGSIFWALSLRYEYLSKAISVFTILNLIAVVLVGVIYFNEALSPANKLGIGLGVLSIILLEL